MATKQRLCDWHVFDKKVVFRLHAFRYPRTSYDIVLLIAGRQKSL